MFKSIIRSIEVRALFVLVSLFALGVLTLLAAVFLMLLTWHWHPWLIFVVCTAPWIVAVIVFHIALSISRCRVARRKKALLASLPLEIFSLVLAYLTQK